MTTIDDKDIADLRIILDAVRKSWALDPDKVAEFNAAVRLREKLETPEYRENYFDNPFWNKY